mmetsp:Transcript_24083/g.33859  ORF Transcript_24083/g.33859 Transcript_24083/m.33859 type:complete len:215 (-) Transcript_24083:635-1279(-)
MAFTAGAASAGSRKRRNNDHSKRKHAIQTKRLARQQRAHDIFERHSADGNYLSESNLEAYISDVVKVPKQSLQPEAVDLVLEMLRKSNEGTGKSTSKLHSRKSVVRAMEKYGEYIKESKKIDQLFKKFDYNKDGELSRKELRNALEDQERKRKRSVNGVSVVVFVEDEDLDIILEHSDADHNGKISRSEVLPAIATWEELASIKIQETKSCVIL